MKSRFTANITTVTSHIAEKIKRIGNTKPEFVVVHISEKPQGT